MPHAFPPSFEGNPWSYAYALFGLTLVAAVSLAHLLAYIGDARRYALARKAPGSFVAPAAPVWTLLGVWRAILACFWLALFLTSAPDVAILFGWGETSDRTMERLFLIDRLCDGTALVPAGGAAFLQLWAAQSMPQRLAEVARTPLPVPKVRMFAKHLKIAAIVLLIAAGVTIGKASA